MKFNLTVKIVQNGNMIISANKAAQNEFRKRIAAGESGADIEAEILQAITENSEYQTCLPEWVGALTSAPMLAIFGEEQPIPEGADTIFFNVVGRWDGVTRYIPVEKCWAYMNYQLNTIPEELIDNGRCVLQYGELTAQQPHHNTPQGL